MEVLAGKSFRFLDCVAVGLSGANDDKRTAATPDKDKGHLSVPLDSVGRGVCHGVPGPARLLPRVSKAPSVIAAAMKADEVRRAVDTTATMSRFAHSRRRQSVALCVGTESSCVSAFTCGSITFHALPCAARRSPVAGSCSARTASAGRCVAAANPSARWRATRAQQSGPSARGMPERTSGRGCQCLGQASCGEHALTDGVELFDGSGGKSLVGNTRQRPEAVRKQPGQQTGTPLGKPFLAPLRHITPDELT
jgi:hypothetical protein